MPKKGRNRVNKAPRQQTVTAAPEMSHCRLSPLLHAERLSCSTEEMLATHEVLVHQRAMLALANKGSKTQDQCDIALSQAFQPKKKQLTQQ